MRIIDAVLICARQGMVLRIHRDNLYDAFVRDSNFISILKSFANVDDTLKIHLENGPKESKNMLSKNSEWNHCMHCEICSNEN